MFASKRLGQKIFVQKNVPSKIFLDTKNVLRQNKLFKKNVWSQNFESIKQGPINFGSKEIFCRKNRVQKIFVKNFQSKRVLSPKKLGLKIHLVKNKLDIKKDGFKNIFRSHKLTEIFHYIQTNSQYSMLPHYQFEFHTKTAKLQKKMYS